MKRSHIYCSLGFLLSLISGQADAAMVFSDDFDSEPVLTYVNGYSSFEKWNVTNGSVDILRYDPAFWFAPTTGGWDSSDGLFVDMGGFESGTIETKNSFFFDVGEYQLSFIASGNLRFRNDRLKVNVGSLFSKEYVFDTNDQKSYFTESFNVTTPSFASIRFENINDDPTENVGVILDDIQVSNNLSVVPEPTSIALLGFGSLGMCVIARRRKRVRQAN